MKRFIVLLIPALLALCQPFPAQAHANIVRSDPEVGAVLERAPQELVLEFTEELDPDFTRVQLLNERGELVNPGPGTIDARDGGILRLRLGDLPNGSYNAIWRVRSAVDGHITEGQVPFGVGMEAMSALIPPPGTPDPAMMPVPWDESVIRWINLLMAALVLGSLAFGLLVWRPALQEAQRAPEHTAVDLSMADAVMAGITHRLVFVGGVVFIITNLLFLAHQAAVAANVQLWQVLGAPGIQLLSGRSGQIWLVRIVLLLALILMTRRLTPIGQGLQWRWWFALLLGGMVLFTFSLNSHGAAMQHTELWQHSWLATALDWAHLLAFVTWLGGLIMLSAAIRVAYRTPHQALPLGVLVPRLSLIAGLCVLILALTGTYSAILHIGSLELLLMTAYGRALLVKLLLFALMLGIGAWHLFMISPRLRMPSEQNIRAFGRSVRVECLIGALVVLAVGVMTSLAPSKIAWQEHKRLGFIEQVEAQGVDLTLRIAPHTIGFNQFAVDVSDPRPGAHASPAQVLLRFGMIGMDMGELEAETQYTDMQRYVAQGNFLSMGGRWQVEVILRRSGFDDVRHVFEVDVLPSE